MVAPRSMLNTPLKMAIFTSGLTQWTVAEKAGIHESRFSKIVRGRLAANDDEKKAIARVLRKRVEELFASEAA
jgi:DNA-binding XRE family transcriptional regulator